MMPDFLNSDHDHLAANPPTHPTAIVWFDQDGAVRSQHFGPPLRELTDEEMEPFWKLALSRMGRAKRNNKLDAPALAC
jgi:hypothetical protein